MGAVGVGAGKLLLFGEHAAVYGHPALGMALPWTTSVSIQATGLQEWILPELPPAERRHLENLIAFLQEGFPAFKKLGGMRLSIVSDIPIGMGFGSSAALCVAFVKAVVTMLAAKVLPGLVVKEIGRSIDLVWDMANRAERLFHGKPSGIDTGLSLLGDVQSFEFHDGGLPRSERAGSAEVFLVIGGVPRRGSTKDLVAKVAAAVAGGEPATGGRIARLGDLSREAKRTLAKDRPGNAAQLGELADEAQAVLASLGLSSDELEAVLASGRAAGARGGKLSGAGGGGAFYLVADDRAGAFRVAESVRGAVAALGLAGKVPVAVVHRDADGANLLAE